MKWDVLNINKVCHCIILIHSDLRDMHSYQIIAETKMYYTQHNYNEAMPKFVMDKEDAYIFKNYKEFLKVLKSIKKHVTTKRVDVINL